MPDDPLTDPLPGPDDAQPRRLVRSTTDKHIAGVAGGLGRYFGIDPVIFRIAFAAATVLSGIGIVAYLALIVFLPNDQGEPAWVEGRSRVTMIVLFIAMACVAVTMLAPPSFLFGPGVFGVAAVSLLCLVLYRSFGGTIKDDPAKVAARATLVAIALAAALGAATGIGLIAALGGGTAMAVIAIVAGFGLIAAGWLGGPRWLILPVVVLIMPLAVVSAADIDLRGGVGEREYRPSSVAQLRPEYRLGMGRVDLDLRSLDLPAGRTPVDVKLGLGELLVRVPDDACVVTNADIGAGEAELPSRVEQGLDVDVPPVQPGRATRTLVLNADIGVGHLRVDGQPEGRCT